jgi:hypothetical protein
VAASAAAIAGAGAGDEQKMAHATPAAGVPTNIATTLSATARAMRRLTTSEYICRRLHEPSPVGAADPIQTFLE